MGGRLWPKFENLRAAKDWGHLAAWTTAGGTTVTAAVGVYRIAYGTSGVPAWQLLSNVLILATLTGLMFRFSRVASIIALVLFLLNALALPVIFPSLRQVFTVGFPFIAFIFINGVRAMFALHRLNALETKPMPYQNLV
jgi:hypothetical protein